MFACTWSDHVWPLWFVFGVASATIKKPLQWQRMPLFATLQIIQSTWQRPGMATILEEFCWLGQVPQSKRCAVLHHCCHKAFPAKVSVDVTVCQCVHMTLHLQHGIQNNTRPQGLQHSRYNMVQQVWRLLCSFGIWDTLHSLALNFVGFNVASMTCPFGHLLYLLSKQGVKTPWFLGRIVESFMGRDSNDSIESRRGSTTAQQYFCHTHTLKSKIAHNNIFLQNAADHVPLGTSHFQVRWSTWDSSGTMAASLRLRLLQAFASAIRPLSPTLLFFPGAPGSRYRLASCRPWSRCSSDDFAW